MLSPGGRDKNKKDHIVINGKWKRSLQDVRATGADVGSDHYLFTAIIKLKLMKVTPRSTSKTFDIGKLRTSKAKEDFKLELRNRFQTLQYHDSENDTQIDKLWERVRETY